MKKEMTIHAAVSYLKTADKRITKALSTDTYVTYAKVSADKISGMSATIAKDDMKGSYQSVTDIVKTVEAIKKAISKANAENTIVVCGEEMTVAEAIYMTSYGIDNRRAILTTLRQQYADAKRSVDRLNGEELERRADQFINSIYGNKEKATGQEALTARENFKKQNSFELVDIKYLESWIDRFEAEVDGAIQVSNATHTITIDV